MTSRLANLPTVSNVTDTVWVDLRLRAGLKRSEKRIVRGVTGSPCTSHIRYC